MFESLTAITVIALGKLGLCLALCLAERGFHVLGVDIDEQRVNQVNHGVAPWYEPGLAELLARYTTGSHLGGGSFRATTQHAQALTHGDCTIVLVPTPQESDGDFSTRYVESALAALAQSLTEKHLFILSSTVLPGTLDGVIIPLIERVSGLRLNEGFGVCYVPDFVALGNVINDFLRPDLVVIGESAAVYGDVVATIYQRLCLNQPAISRMSLISAELAKVSLNAYITMKISFANTLANLCECIPGADVDAITQAIGADRRISPHYLRGGTAFGGSCFPRDVSAFLRLAEVQGTQAELQRITTRLLMCAGCYKQDSLCRPMKLFCDQRRQTHRV